MCDIRVLCEASEKGKFVVNMCLNNGYDINTKKLEKLLILMQGEMLRRHKKTFFEQVIIVKDNEAIIPKVERDFKMYNEGFKERLSEYYFLTNNEQEVMNSIIEQYGNMNIADLNERRELKILSQFIDETDELNLNIVPKQLIQNVFIRSNFFEHDLKKQDRYVKQKVLATK